MDLLSKILSLRRLSIVGMEKNTGKTVCLNYLLRQLAKTDRVVAVTSIGLDGEKIDQVTLTEKPEIELDKGLFFVTSEYHYRQRQLVAEICQVSEEVTSLGRLITAKVIQKGKVILTGPASTAGMGKLMEQLEIQGVDLSIVDGALSRKSPASPAITDGMILTTGMAVAPDLNTVIAKTKALYQLTQIPEFATSQKEEMMLLDSGIYAVNDHQLQRLPIASSLLFTKCKETLFQYGNTLFVGGIVTDNMLEYLRLQSNIKEVTLVVKDFTKLFVTPMVLASFLQRGGKLNVLKRPNLLAVCINPVAPSGFKVDSEQFRERLQKEISVPVIDVMQMEA